MVFSSEGKIFIKNLVLLKGCSSRSRRKVGIKMTSMHCCERFENGQRGSSAWQRTTAFGAHAREHWCFVEPWVKVNGEYYRNVLLMEKTSLSSSRTAPHSTSSKGHHCVAATWNTKLHWTGTVASKLTRPQSSWLQNLGSNRGTRLPDSNTGHRRVNGAPHRCVGIVEAECHWQSYWTESAKAENLRSSEGTSLRTSY